MAYEIFYESTLADSTAYNVNILQFTVNKY